MPRNVRLEVVLVQVDQHEEARQLRHDVHSLPAANSGRMPSVEAVEAEMADHVAAARDLSDGSAATLAPPGVGDDVAANALNVPQRALLEEQARRMKALEALAHE